MPPPSHHENHSSSRPTRGPTPYIGRRARLSQVWLNRWTVLLALVLVRALFLFDGLDKNLGDAKENALAACSKVEDVGSAMASMPHYLSAGVNELAARGITDTVQGLVAALTMVLTAVQELLLFVINMMTSTYVCLLSAAVHGGLNVSAHVVTLMTDAINAAIDPLASEIGAAVSDFDGAVDKAWGQIGNLGNTVKGGLGSLFSSGGGKTPALPAKPRLDMAPEINKLRGLRIDTSGFVADLNTLNEDLPDFDDVQDLTRAAVSLPFDLVKKALNNTYGEWEMAGEALPTADKKALTFCSDNHVLVEFFEALYKIAHRAKVAIVVIVSALALLACIPMGYLEARRWKRLARFASRKGNYDNLDYITRGARPMTSHLGLTLANRASRTPERQHLVRWWVAYSTTWPALLLLSLAAAGFVSCACQYAVLRAVEKEVPAITVEVRDFAHRVVVQLEDVSAAWAQQANGVVLSIQDELNEDLLGYVRNATGAVNDALDTFTRTMDKSLTQVFGDTVLKEPIKEVVRCLIGLKIEAVQRGLEWVHEHSHVSFPLLANSTFSAGAQQSLDGDAELGTFLAMPGRVTTDAVSGAVARVTDWIRNSLIQELVLSLGLLLLYVIVVLLGAVRMLVSLLSMSSSKFNVTESRPDFENISQPGLPRSTVAERPVIVSQRREHHQSVVPKIEGPFF